MLALRELEELSYDEIAAIMEMNRNSVAQLISRARISLRDELKGTALAVARRVLARLRARAAADRDRAGPPARRRVRDAAWLDEHMAGCDTCRRPRGDGGGGRLLPCVGSIAAAPWLFKETMAKAAELTGEDWSHLIDAGSEAGAAEAEDDKPRWHKRRDVLLAGLLAAIALIVGFEAAIHDDEPPADRIAPAAEETQAPVARKETKKKKSGRVVETQLPIVPPVNDSTAPPSSDESSDRTSKKQDAPGQEITKGESDSETGFTPPAGEPPAPTEPPATEPPPTTPPPTEPPRDPPAGCPPQQCPPPGGSAPPKRLRSAGYAEAGSALS